MSIHRSSVAARYNTTWCNRESFCDNSSASFKRILNVKLVLIYTLHNIIVCDLLHPIVACRPCRGPLILSSYPSDMMIIPLVLSSPNSVLTITGRFRGVNHQFCSRPSALSHHLWLSTRPMQTPKALLYAKRNNHTPRFGPLQRDLAYSRAAARLRR